MGLKMSINNYKWVLRFLPLLVVLPILYFLWFGGGDEALEQSVSRVNTAPSSLIGSRALNFKFEKKQAWDGKELELHTVSGKKVLLHFWATWCGPCVLELPELMEMAERESKDLMVIAIAVDKDWQTIGSFLERYPKLKKLPEVVSLYLDPEGKIPSQYGTNGLPESFLLGRDLTVISKLVGAQPWLDKRMQALLDSAPEQKR
jgi:cytochrome c biogenesis protein CcmG, thiol:disulfide interchange protein DsbE